MENNELIINRLFSKYHLDYDDQEYMKSMFVNIINHNEFQKRLTNEFLHHSNITLGEHILEDSIVTYLLAKKKNNVRIDLTVKIALLHDLYTIPWQNNSDAKVKHFYNKHGFRHPIEAIINAITWYSDIFENKGDAIIIIDGILHHMFPLPVRILSYQNINNVELKNIENFNKLPKDYKDMIIKSLNRKKIGPFSFSRSKYSEGKIMSLADKKVSSGQIKNISSAFALLTGHNKSIK